MPQVNNKSSALRLDLAPKTPGPALGSDRLDRPVLMADRLEMTESTMRRLKRSRSFPEVTAAIGAMEATLVCRHSAAAGIAGTGTAASAGVKLTVAAISRAACSWLIDGNAISNMPPRRPGL